jgi:hypothetical protein
MRVRFIIILLLSLTGSSLALSYLHFSRLRHGGVAAEQKKKETGSATEITRETEIRMIEHLKGTGKDCHV